MPRRWLLRDQPRTDQRGKTRVKGEINGETERVVRAGTEADRRTRLRLERDSDDDIEYSGLDHVHRMHRRNGSNLGICSSANVGKLVINRGVYAVRRVVMSGEDRERPD